jgi:hypothetical protein
VPSGDWLRGVALPLAGRSRLLPRARHVARVQSAYYLVTGLWPLLSRGSFEAVTGRKQDFWLVQTVGALVGVTGATLAAAARDQRSLQSPAVRTLAIGSALSLATIDLAFVLRGRISPIYLVDAAVELGLVAGWLVRGSALPVPDAWTLGLHTEEASS